jgi:hypothetical protein
MTNNGRQSTTQKTKDWASRSPLKTRDQNQTFQKVPFFSVHSLYNFLSWYLTRCELAQMVSEIKEVRGPKETTIHISILQTNPNSN